MKNIYNFKRGKICRKSVVFSMLVFMSFLFSNQLNAQCTADAGTLDANVTPVQLAGTDVSISATQGTAPTVPTNYEVAYVLTSGPTLIIEQLGATPSFDVTSAGDYTIHTLVAELDDPADPNFLDVGIVVPGTTTGGDVLDFVVSNGLCAALDVTGAAVVVEDCTADAGTLTADVTPVQSSGGGTMISATQATAPTVPANYEVAYVLTSGPNLRIRQTGLTPIFTVYSTGTYTIHTLVAELNDATDPNFLDTSVIVPGTTTGGDVLDIVTAGGLCAALDVTGAPIVVETCTADAGTLTADATPVQISGGSATISATQGTAPTVPSNYEVAYVLTSGATLIIEQLGATPEFTVTTAGDYTIHTLVAELDDPTDPNFLDVSIVVPGTTTGGDVLGLVTAGGLCAALDVAGAPVVVEDCTADAGTLTTDVSPVQLSGGSATISATQGTAPTVPTNYEVAYVLTSGPTLIIEQLGATPSFDVTSAGDYTIHTLVAELDDPTDPNFLDVSIVVPGTTT
ncbi:hypothetical protein OAD62_05250, partial [Oceanihabitans sp.]|nr:hypothetical protein [Oceanihabitans sp.]